MSDLTTQEHARISREDYYKLIGLLTLAAEHNRALDVIRRAAVEITKERGDPELGYTADATIGAPCTADDLLGRLGIEVADV